MIAMSKEININKNNEKKIKAGQNNQHSQLDQRIPTEQSDFQEQMHSEEHDLEKINFAQLPIASDLEE